MSLTARRPGDKVEEEVEKEKGEEEEEEEAKCRRGKIVKDEATRGKNRGKNIEVLRNMWIKGGGLQNGGQYSSPLFCLLATFHKATADIASSSNIARFCKVHLIMLPL